MKLIPESPSDITAIIAHEFRSFGGNQPANGNPIAAAMAGQPAAFAASVDIQAVVDRVLELAPHVITEADSDLEVIDAYAGTQDS